VDLVVLEVDELLRAHGYIDVPIVKGSALGALLGDPRWTATIEELVATLDRAIPEPVRDVTSPFLMPVESVHTITGIGTVVTGRVSRGVITVGDMLEIIGRTDTTDIVITGIESFHREQREARAGENVGLRVRGLAKSEVARGHVLAAPGSIQPHRTCTAELYLLSAKEGGRAKPIRTGYMPQVFVGATDVTATFTMPSELTPGDRATIDMAFQRPIALEAGVRFAVREGRRTIGAGVVTAVE
jgi:elongation factor Tu